MGQEQDKYGQTLVSAGGSTAFEGLSSHYGMQGKPGMVGENLYRGVNPNPYQTVSGERVPSGTQGPLHMQLAEAQEILSLGSGAGFGD